MFLKNSYISLLILSSFIIFIKCRKKEDINSSFTTTPYNLSIPENFPEFEVPNDNPLTVEGVKLGRHLFWETKLSGNNLMSCGTCHSPQSAFSDANQYSQGINGDIGKRNSMVLQNLAWANDFFWDGRVISLEEQILMPVMDSTEMDETWSHFFEEIKYDNQYRRLFYDAFQTTEPDSTHAAKAIAQFLRTMISGNSKYDRVLNDPSVSFTPMENAGFDSFNSLTGGDCFHCHGGILGTDFSYKNNGLDENPVDTGRGLVSGNLNDYYKFKVPSIRNIEYSAPYMHDGRFQTLDQVIHFYSVGVHSNSPNLDPLMEFSQQGGVQLNPNEREELKAFLLTLSDSAFINNPNFSNPH